MKKLDDKVALITGGGTGIGRKIAELFSQEGAVIAICGRREEPLKETCEKIRQSGGRCNYYLCDIGDEKETVDMFCQIEDDFGRIDVLVNNASVVGQIAPIEEMDITQWENALRINLTGLMVCCREAVKRMKRQKSGAIVNVSSNVGRRGFRNRSPYVCSKWAMHGLSQTIALECGNDGIRCNTICPGPVLTERLENSIKKQAAARGMSEDAIVAEWTAESPMKRFATKEECAKAALFLACDDSSGMTGQALNVTAGVIMS